MDPSVTLQHKGAHPSLPILSVSQLTRAIKLQLETTFPLVFVEGEVSNCKIQSSGHIYFSLKDANAQVQAVLFRGQASKLVAKPKDGDQVLIKGELNVYPPRGNYQIIIHELSFVGVGALLQKLEERKRKLQAQGWFSAEKKKPLSPFPRVIGVITSPTGAVIQDILNILTRRMKRFCLLLYPVKVQGEGAAEEIATAIREMNRYRLADVLIVGRGGGSIEDLWAFNEEVVAEAVFYSEIPIISAVGHETDFCLIDFVADVRAPTPSAAAELVSKEQQHLVQTLAQACKHLTQTLRHLIGKEQKRLEAVSRQLLFVSPTRLLANYLMRLEDRQVQIDRLVKDLLREKKWRLSLCKKSLFAHTPFQSIQRYREQLIQLHRAIFSSVQVLLRRKKEKTEHLQELLHAVNPRHILQKGYSILFSEKGGSIIKSVQQLKEHQGAFLSFADGDAKIRIEEIIIRDKSAPPQYPSPV